MVEPLISNNVEEFPVVQLLPVPLLPPVIEPNNVIVDSPPSVAVPLEGDPVIELNDIVVDPLAVGVSIPVEEQLVVDKDKPDEVLVEPQISSQSEVVIEPNVEENIVSESIVSSSS